MDRQVSLSQQLHDWIVQLPNVIEEPHRFGGREFRVEGLEFMHSHGPSFLDIRLSMSDQEWALKVGGAIPHQFAPQAGWVSFRLESDDDLEKAKRIIRRAYDNAKASMEAHLARRARSN